MNDLKVYEFRLLILKLKKFLNKFQY